MISPLTPMFAHAVPSPRPRERQAGKENFRDLLNCNPSNGDSPSVATGDQRGNTPSTGEPLARRPATDAPAGDNGENGASAATTKRTDAEAPAPSQSPLVSEAVAAMAPSNAPSSTREATQIALATAAVRVTTGAASDPVQLIAMPWRLQANAGLSYYLTGAKTQAIAELPSPHHNAAAVAAMPSARAAAMTPAAEVAVAESHAAMMQSGATNFVSDRVQRSAAMSVAADVAMPGRPASALLLWPHRLLRWLADSDAGLTAWVRDYRLDATQATQLIDSLRCLAQQQGHSLHRIMLNGHELWRAPSNRDSN